MSSKDFKEYFVILVEECSKLEQETSATGIHTALKSVYRVIKKYVVEMKNSNALTPEECESAYLLIKSLILILIENDVPADVMLLCGTCLSLLVSITYCPELASSFLMCLYCHFHERYSGKQIISSESKRILKEEVLEDVKSFPVATRYFEKHTESNNSACVMMPSFQQIAILNGIVSCQVPELYCFQLDSFEKKPFLIYVFNAIHQCCLSPSVHQYHAFNVLLNWTRMCEMFFHKFHAGKTPFFSTKEIIVQKILNLLESNWQSPIKGINGFIKEIYKGIIKLNEKECTILYTDHMYLIQYLSDKTIKLSWQVKGKYFLLSVLLQYMDYSKFFEEDPDASSNIIFSLKANYISSSVAEVYKVIVTNMK